MPDGAPAPGPNDEENRMYWLVALMSLGIAGLIACGLYLELRPAGASGGRRWHKPAIGVKG